MFPAVDQRVRLATAVMACASDINDELTLLLNSGPDDEVKASIQRMTWIVSALANVASRNGARPTAASGVGIAEMM